MAKRKRKKQNKGRWFALIFFHILVLGLYLWGKIEIGFMIREINQLETDKNHLEREIYHLKLRIDQKKQYNRIVPLAKKQKLLFISTNDVSKLVVDYSGLSVPFQNYMIDFRMAGIHLINFNK